MSKILFILMILLIGAGLVPTVADEGFWTFEQPPIEQLAKKHGLKTNAAWFNRIERATLKFGSRMGAGVAVSPDGLVLMTRHQIESWIAEIGFVGPSMLESGFLASRREREVKLDGLTAEQFHSLRDVTSLISERINSSEKDPKEIERAAIRELVEAESTRTGLLCRVQHRVAAKRYVLYRFRVWSDIRLVFSPETSMASFGGQFDNFSFPRWSFDVALVRLYESDKPSTNVDHLRLAANPTKEGDVLVSTGYPRATKRGDPWPVLEEERKTFLPLAEKLLSALQESLRKFCAANEKHGAAQSQLASVSNTLKAFQGFQVALDSPRIVAKLRRREQLVKGSGGDNAKALASRTKALELELKTGRSLMKRRMCSRLESRMASRARSLLHLATALKQPAAKRSKRYRGSSLTELKSALSKPVDTELQLEILVAGTRIRIAQDILGENDPFVLACKKSAKGKGVVEALKSSRLMDESFCVSLIQGAPESIDESEDPILDLVRDLDPIWSELWGENRARERHRLDKLSNHYNSLLDQVAPIELVGVAPAVGTDRTPRITIGTAAGYDNGVTAIPAFTSLWGLFGRQRAMGAKSPFKISPRWELARDRLNLDTQMVVATNLEAVDNVSGSPVVGKEGKLRGIIFDSNFEGLAHDYVHESEQGRALMASSSLILEALRKVYRADILLKELAPPR